jgi:hypothetical protein
VAEMLKQIGMSACSSKNNTFIAKQINDNPIALHVTFSKTIETGD